MDFAYSPKVQELRERVTAFMEAYVYPAEAVFEEQVNEGDRWQPTAIMEELKAKAKAEADKIKAAADAKANEAKSKAKDAVKGKLKGFGL